MCCHVCTCAVQPLGSSIALVIRCGILFSQWGLLVIFCWHALDMPCSCKDWLICGLAQLSMHQGILFLMAWSSFDFVATVLHNIFLRMGWYLCWFWCTQWKPVFCEHCINILGVAAAIPPPPGLPPSALPRTNADPSPCKGLIDCFYIDTYTRLDEWGSSSEVSASLSVYWVHCTCTALSTCVVMLGNTIHLSCWVTGHHCLD